MKAEIERCISGEGSLSEKYEYYRIYLKYKITYFDNETGEKSTAFKQKYFATDIPVKGNNLRKAKQIFKAVYENFDPYNPNVPLAGLLKKMGSENGNDYESPAMKPVQNMNSPEPAETWTQDKLASNYQPVPEQAAEGAKRYADSLLDGTGGKPPTRNTVVSVEGPDNDILFSDYMLRWLDYCKSKVEKNTFAGYKIYVVTKIVPYFAEKGIYLNQLTSKDVHQFYQYLRENGASPKNRARKGKKGLSSETLRRIHANVRKALVDAASDELDLLHTNILSTLKRPEKPPVEEFQPSFYSQEEVNALFDVSEGHKLEIPIKLAGFYGLRRSEIIGLRWSDINFEDGFFTINNIITQATIDGKYQIYEKERAKNKKSRRTFTLDDEMRKLLLDHKDWINRNMKRLKGGYNMSRLNYVCVDETGELIKPGYFTKYNKVIILRNKMREIRLHDLRHTNSGLLLSKGTSLQAVKVHLGHADYKTTDKYYGHLDQSARKATVNTMSQMGLHVRKGAIKKEKQEE